ncbi:hypothetical protein [Planobispora longispora]|uniref:Uncharacterized protein n=1 Tax=Planobispora longispora TaxID=28887 RepID=A0A8J3RKP8_9ACTN|nr:hypothetical protein [Planobispora longispora]GIH78296.1 hypothetical protein Plo01_47250 [Planobispora longispora]
MSTVQLPVRIAPQQAGPARSAGHDAVSIAAQGGGRPSAPERGHAGQAVEVEAEVLAVDSRAHRGAGLVSASA